MVVLAVTIPSTIFFVAGQSVLASFTNSSQFHSTDELAALDWLNANAAPDSIVMSTHTSGAMLPAFAPVRVYVGHGPETVNSSEKTAIADEFFGGGMGDANRQKLLRDNRIAYVWVGPQEESLACGEQSCFDAQRLALKPVFQSGAYVIYEVGP
jgi:hypothetical protein